MPQERQLALIVRTFAVIERQAATADPQARDGDDLWWNWCRMPAGLSLGAGDPSTVAMVPGVAELVGDWLGRRLTTEPARVVARDALIHALS